MITVDTNVYISAIRFGGKPAELLQLAFAKKIQVAISQPILDEAMRVFQEKFNMSSVRLEEAENLIRSSTVMVEPKMRMNVITEDEPDNRIIEYAIESRSDTIVTGDNDLLRRGQYEGIRMVPPHTYLRETGFHR